MATRLPSASKLNDRLTGIRLAVAVGSGGWRAVPGLHLQRVSALLFAIEHHLREDLAGLSVDLEVILPLVPVAVHHVIRHLKHDHRRLWIIVRLWIELYFYIMGLYIYLNQIFFNARLLIEFIYYYCLYLLLLLILLIAYYLNSFCTRIFK